MGPITIDWSTAEVHDRELTVALKGERPDGWKQRFGRTLVLLGKDRWGEVRLKKSGIVVSDIAPGTEEKLRHFLESVVAQTNAAEEAQSDPEPEQQEEPGSEEGEDVELTRLFRSFAGEGETD